MPAAAPGTNSAKISSKCHLEILKVSKSRRLVPAVGTDSVKISSKCHLEILNFMVFQPKSDIFYRNSTEKCQISSPKVPAVKTQLGVGNHLIVDSEKAQI